MPKTVDAARHRLTLPVPSRPPGTPTRRAPAPRTPGIARASSTSATAGGSEVRCSPCCTSAPAAWRSSSRAAARRTASPCRADVPPPPPRASPCRVDAPAGDACRRGRGGAPAHGSRHHRPHAGRSHPGTVPAGDAVDPPLLIRRTTEHPEGRPGARGGLPRLHPLSTPWPRPPPPWRPRRRPGTWPARGRSGTPRRGGSGWWPWFRPSPAPRTPPSRTSRRRRTRPRRP